ncbi:NRPS-like enzyme [Mycena sanguinolenta]|uniref:NRPS-like enzyme n=1 Tax=Mycena sanguinolenta TaxID=230812 RepID=A0A8H6XJW9_9AGAR|nr:NRPS-like enzyme [Mycena sanguinolenta]
MSTYTPAPVDGSLSLLQIFEFQATTNPHQPIFRYDSASARDGYENITWQQAVKMFDKTAQILRRRIGNTALMDCADRPVVGILAVTSSILYASLVVGTVRAGYTVFPLSTRNSDAAIAHLIAESGMKHLLISQDSHMQDIACKANALLNARNIKIGILPIPTYEEISDTQHTDLDALPPLQPIPDERVLVIAHSSGSTSFPKVVPLTHKYIQAPKGSRPSDLSSWVQSTHSAAMFHIMGIMTLMRAAYSGMVLALFAPTTNGVIPTPERVLQSALATRCKTMHWAEDPSSIEKLKSFSHVAFTGGPLAQQAGDILQNSGVALMPYYGTTETGSISRRFTNEKQEESWQYFQFVPGTDAVLVPIDGDSSGLLFQLIIKESAAQSLALSNMEIDGVIWAHWKVRNMSVDDQIMHSNGEKTNPGPIEYILAQNPLVQSAIMFGRAKPHAGVLVVPSDKKVLDIQSFRDAIWPITILKGLQLNRQTTLHLVIRGSSAIIAHNQISQMIIFFNPSKLFHTNSKGTPKRYAILKDHAQEIEDAYDAFDKTASSSVSSTGTIPRDISINDALEIVRAHVHAHVNPNVTDNEDMFEAGADRQVVWCRLGNLCSKYYCSLLAARIRRDIIQSLSEPHLKVPDIVAQSLPNDVVFASPTIGRLASFIFGVIVCAATFPHMGDNTYIKNVPASILDQEDNTIVRLREPAAGQSPLILIHGGGGSVYPFMKHRERVFVAQTDFYHHKIKELQPNGPYRLGGYSAGAIMACVITKLLEANGDKVIQLAFIDSSPLVALTPRPGLDTSADFSDVQTLHDHHERSVRGFCKMLRGYNDAWWTKFAAVVWEHWTGRLRPEDMSELMERLYENLVGGMIRTFDFILDQALGDQKGYKDVLEGMVQWTKEIQAPITVYKATDGIIQNIPPDSREKWGAFGVDWAHEDVRVVELRKLVPFVAPAHRPPFIIPPPPRPQDESKGDNTQRQMGILEEAVTLARDEGEVERQGKTGRQGGQSEDWMKHQGRVLVHDRFNAMQYPLELRVGGQSRTIDALDVAPAQHGVRASVCTKIKGVD